MNLQYRPVRKREERGMFILHLTFSDVYALFSDVSLRRRASMTQAQGIPGPFLLKSDVNLFNHLVRKADVAEHLITQVLFFVDMRLPRIQCRWFVLSEVVFTLSWCRSINTIPRHNWLFDVVWWPPRTLWYVDDNHYLAGPFRWKKRYQKKHRRE